MERYFSEHAGARDQLTVCVETAHPAKFPEEIKSVIGIDPALPPSLAHLDACQEEYGRMPCDYGGLRNWLISRFA